MRPEAVVTGGGVPYLHAIDGNVYHDWETVYRHTLNRLSRLLSARVANPPAA